MTDNDRLVIIQFTSENKLNIIFCWLSVSLCCINGGMVSPLQFSSSDDLACFGAYYRLCLRFAAKLSLNLINNVDISDIDCLIINESETIVNTLE